MSPSHFLPSAQLGPCLSATLGAVLGPALPRPSVVLVEGVAGVTKSIIRPRCLGMTVTELLPDDRVLTRRALMGVSASQSRGRVGSRRERPCAVAPSCHHPGPGALTTSLEPSTLGLKHDRPGLTLARSLVELSFSFLKDGAMASLWSGCDVIARASIFHGVTLVLLSHLQSHNRPFWGPGKLLPRWVGWVGRNGGGRYGGGGQHRKQTPPPSLFRLG